MSRAIRPHNHQRPSTFAPAPPSTALAGVALLLSTACGAPPPASAERIQPTPLTHLEGEVELPNGAALSYAAVLAPDPLLERGYLGTIDIPRQALRGASLEGVRFLPGEHVEFQLSASGSPRWVGHYNADGTLECRFFQGQESLPCTMRQVTAEVPHPPTPALARQTPRPPFPYRVSQVQVENRAAHVVLAGTLSMPNGPGPHPALLLLGDGEVRDRDGTQGQHKPYLVLADHLTRAGIAVLRLDDRGVGGSAGGQPEATPQDLEGDARAALSFLRARPHVDLQRVGLLTHGTSAAIAAQMAAADASVAYLVLLSAPAEPSAAFQGVHCPVLVLSGEQGNENDATLALRAQRAALSHSPGAVLVSLPELDQHLRRVDADGSAASGIAEETVAPAALERISSWLAHTLRR